MTGRRLPSHLPPVSCTPLCLHLHAGQVQAAAADFTLRDVLQQNVCFSARLLRAARSLSSFRPRGSRTARLQLLGALGVQSHPEHPVSVPRDRLQANADPQPARPRLPAGGPAAVGGLAAARLQALPPGHQEVPVLALRPGVSAGARRPRQPLQKPLRGREGRLRPRDERLRVPVARDVQLLPVPAWDGALHPGDRGAGGADGGGGAARGGAQRSGLDQV